MSLIPSSALGWPSLLLLLFHGPGPSCQGPPLVFTERAAVLGQALREGLRIPVSELETEARRVKSPACGLRAAPMTTDPCLSVHPSMWGTDRGPDRDSGSLSL